MARRAYHAAYHFGKVHPDVWHLDGIREVAGSCYGRSLELLNQLAEAEQLLLKAAEEFPMSARLRRQLIALYVRQGRRKDALAEVDLLPPETPYREALASAVRGACLAVQNKWVPARAYLEAAYRGGCRDTICLQYYAQSLVTSGQVNAAIPVLAEWRQIDPQNPALLSALADVAAKATSSDTIIRSLPAPILAPRGGTGFQPVG
jgi:predicted Zn-dependent protease